MADRLPDKSSGKAKALVTVEDLFAQGLVAKEQVPALQQVAREFSIRLTPEVLRQIKGERADDPVALQYVPQTKELEVSPQEIADPIGDDVHEKTKGLIHRYRDRVLLKPTTTCQVYCRFCFRREMVGQGQANLDADELAAALAYVAAHNEIREVILSGGDPLVLSDRRLGALIQNLAEIEHVEMLRIHTRVPLVDPDRITPELIGALKGGKPLFMVIHVNHAQELSARVTRAIALLVDHGIPVLSQSVLLKGVNNSVEDLAELFRSLVANRVKPYYLHHLDRARGTSHFRCSIAEGQKLMEDLQANVSGLCLPSFMLDIPGGFGKVPIGRGQVAEQGSNRYQVIDPAGRPHLYVDEA